MIKGKTVTKSKLNNQINQSINQVPSLLTNRNGCFFYTTFINVFTVFIRNHDKVRHCACTLLVSSRLIWHSNLVSALSMYFFIYNDHTYCSLNVKRSCVLFQGKKVFCTQTLDNAGPIFIKHVSTTTC